MASTTEDLPCDFLDLVLFEGLRRSGGTLLKALGPKGNSVEGIAQIMVHIGVKPVPCPVSCFQLGQKPFALGEEPGVLNGHTCLSRQHLHDGFILLCEGQAVGFVDEVEVAHGLAPNPNRNAQERGGHGVAVRNPGRPGIIRGPCQTDGLVRLDDRTQEPMSRG